jgi:hypothetical protein
MVSSLGILETLLAGPLAETHSLPLVIYAALCNLRPRFLPKGCVGRGHRAIARNGRVLLASHAPVEDLAGRLACVRLQIWHKAILPGDPPTPFGLLLWIREIPHPNGVIYQTRLAQLASPADEPGSALHITVGGGMVLNFSPPTLDCGSGYGASPEQLFP